MTDYNLYRSEKGISNNQIIRIVSKEYRGFNKIQCSMISNPEKYGVCLIPEAEKLLIDSFGEGSGLLSTVHGTQLGDTAESVRKKKPVRSKPNRLVVYLNNELNIRVRELMYSLKFDTVQDFLESALAAMVENSAGGEA